MGQIRRQMDDEPSMGHQFIVSDPGSASCSVRTHAMAGTHDPQVAKKSMSGPFLPIAGHETDEDLITWDVDGSRSSKGSTKLLL